MHSYVSPTSGFNYSLSQLPADFSSAVKACNALGGHLAAFADIAEQQVGHCRAAWRGAVYLACCASCRAVHRNSYVIVVSGQAVYVESLAALRQEYSSIRCHWCAFCMPCSLLICRASTSTAKICPALHQCPQEVEAHFASVSQLSAGRHPQYWLGLSASQAGNRSAWSWLDRSVPPPSGE